MNYGLKYIFKVIINFGEDLKKQVIYQIIKLAKNKKLKNIILNGKINDSRQFIFISVY